MPGGEDAVRTGWDTVAQQVGLRFCMRFYVPVRRTKSFDLFRAWHGYCTLAPGAYCSKICNVAARSNKDVRSTEYR